MNHHVRPLPSLDRVYRRQRHTRIVSGSPEVFPQPLAKANRVRLESGQLAQCRQVIGMGCHRPVAPSVQGVGAGVKPTVADPRPHYREHGGSGGAGPARGPAHRDDIADEVAYLLRFATAALVLQPVRQIAEAFKGSAPGHEVQE